MKVSNCCGENGNVKFYETEWLYSEAGMCPRCGEHCEYIEEETQKTALMELIEYFEKNKEEHGMASEIAISVATELLQKEQEYFEDCYNQGRYDGEDGNIPQFKSGTDYYNKTYKS